MNTDDVARINASSFWARVDRRGSDECWEWQGGCTWLGYGRVYVPGSNQTVQRTVYAHQVAAFSAFGPPESRDIIVMHHCDNPPCCNPRHLRYGTKKDNTRDMMAKGRLGAGRHNRAKTHCPQGHPYDQPNTYVTPAGTRQCRICKRLDAARRYKPRRAAA